MDGYQTVASFVAPSIGKVLLAVDEGMRKQITEIRIKQDTPVSLFSDRSWFLLPDGRLQPDAYGGLCPSKEEIQETFLRLCGYSVQSCEEKIKEGFFTLPGGHRVGICGRAVLEHGKISAVGDITSFTRKSCSFGYKNTRKSINIVRIKVIHQIFLRTELHSRRIGKVLCNLLFHNPIFQFFLLISYSW